MKNNKNHTNITYGSITSKIEFFRQRKLELGYSYRQLSELTGIPVGTLQKMFNGATRSPRFKTLAAVEAILGKPTAQTSEAGIASSRNYTPTSGDAACLRDNYRLDSYENNSDLLHEEAVACEDNHYLDKGKEQGDYTIEDYLAIPDERRVELIDGVIYDMSSPTAPHQLVAGELFFQIKTFLRNNQKQCIPFIAPFDVQLDCDDRTMVQPDVIIVCHHDRLNRKRLFGAPDFAAEVLSPSTRKKDMSLKRRKYEAAGVLEYWMIDPDKQKVIVHLFGDEPDINIYGFDQPIPIALTDGQCIIDFSTLVNEMAAAGL